MEPSTSPIPLTDILRFDDIRNVKVRFNLSMGSSGRALDVFDSGNQAKLMEGQYWNYEKKRSYSDGQITVGLARYGASDLWLLFHVGKITKDLNKLNGIGYEHESIHDFDKYIGRLVVRYKNRGQNLVRLASSVFDQCEVVEILPGIYNADHFPGYDHVNITWRDMKRLLRKEAWKAALQNQKGIYLITDTGNGKMYVGSAYGEKMLLGRWQSYLSTGHGGNKELKTLSREHIKNHFRYSILDIFKSKYPDEQILERESWWKNVLQSRTFGYNSN